MCAIKISKSSLNIDSMHAGVGRGRLTMKERSNQGFKALAAQVTLPHALGQDLFENILTADLYCRRSNSNAN